MMRGRATPFFGRGRDYAIYVSQLLKVVETQIWAQTDRNSRVYKLALITTLSSQTFRFLVICQKLKFTAM